MMIAVQAGNSAVYRRLLSEVAAWLATYYARRLPASMIDDAVQEVLLALHEKRHVYDPARPFEVWLAAIARYKWIDALRRMKATSTEALEEDLPVEDHEEAVVNANSLDRLLARLKPAQSAAIRLVKLEGLSIEEASQATGQSTSLVRVNIHRGLRKLISFLRSERHAD